MGLQRGEGRALRNEGTTFLPFAHEASTSSGEWLPPTSRTLQVRFLLAHRCDRHIGRAAQMRDLRAGGEGMGEGAGRGVGTGTVPAVCSSAMAHLSLPAEHVRRRSGSRSDSRGSLHRFLGCKKRNEGPY